VSSTSAERYRSVVERVAEAAVRSGRVPAEVTIVVAAKTFGADRIAEVISAGAREIGENYVQEARRKAAELRLPDVHWHLIGRLQRNKVRQALALFRLIHSLDRLDLAEALDAAAAQMGTTARCLVEVNLGGERSKGGVSPDALGQLLEAVAALGHLSIEGLMAIPPPGSIIESRRSFARLRALRDWLADLRLPNVQLKELSMGMSSDFEGAIEEGATLVRIGTTIFGPRTT
jgi:PLP dependent protein